MRMTLTLLPDVLSVNLVIHGGFRDWPIKAITERGVAKCPQVLIFSRFDPVLKRIAACRTKQSGISGNSRLLFCRGGWGYRCRLHGVGAPLNDLPVTNVDQSGDASHHPRPICLGSG
jgi:hypothetical protein